jgi:hypoxanthine phosphoribosyltransferase
VLVVDSIVDLAGFVLPGITSIARASVEVCVLLRKRAAAQMPVEVAYTGFEIEDKFVIGYGLDYAERYRNLPFIGTLAPHAYAAETLVDPQENTGDPQGNTSEVE